MNVLNPLSYIMSTDLKVLNPEDSMQKVKDLFETHKIHHLPVVSFKEVVGIISKSDFLYFMNVYNKDSYEEMMERIHLKNWKVKEVMTTNVYCLQKDDTTMKALELFARNQFHSIPILDKEVLVGIVTPYDIIKRVIKEGLVSIELDK